MPQYQEKDSKNTFALESKDDIPDTRYQETEGPAYTESKKTWRSFFWSSKPPKDTQENGEQALTVVALDVPKEEARFLTKLDLTLISASALGVMCRYLDQVNITNAFSK
jgi:ACS family pantothenate transporter-like MFS transporter